MEKRKTVKERLSLLDINLNEIKLVLFDLDDTLYDRSLPFMKAFEAYSGIKVSDKSVAARAYITCTARGDEVFLPSQRGEITMQEMYIYRFTKGFADVGIVISDGQALEFQEVYSQMLKKLELDQEMKNIMDECLQKNIQMGIITNGPAKHQRDKIKVLGLDRWINQDLIFISGEVGYDKPDLRIFQMAQDAVSCLPNEIILIGDSIKNDIRPAEKMGWKTMWVQRR